MIFLFQPPKTADNATKRRFDDSFSKAGTKQITIATLRIGKILQRGLKIKQVKLGNEKSCTHVYKGAFILRKAEFRRSKKVAALYLDPYTQNAVITGAIDVVIHELSRRKIIGGKNF